MMDEEKQSTRSPRNPTNLEKEEAWLWRIELIFVVMLEKG